MFSTCCYISVCPTGTNNYEMLELIFWPLKLTVRILKMMIGKLHFSSDGTFRRAIFQILGVRISTMHILNIIGISSGFAHSESYRIFGACVFHTNQSGWRRRETPQ